MMTRKSIGLLAFGLCLLHLGACASKRSSDAALSEEVRLKEDRSHLDGLRSDIPEEQRKENDELAFVLGLFKERTEEPSKIRDRYDRVVRRKRDEMDRTIQRDREDFRREESRKREQFNEKAREEREAYLDKERDSGKRSTFFSNQEADRRRFYADEQDARKEFEVKINDRRSDFEEYLKDKRRRFDAEYSAYQKEWTEIQREEERKKEQKRRAAPPTNSQNELDEFRQIPQGKQIRLQPEDGE